jgi:hypothetical protein
MLNGLNDDNQAINSNGDRIRQIMVRSRDLLESIYMVALPRPGDMGVPFRPPVLIAQ